MRKKYKTVSISEEHTTMIEDVIDSDNYGYSSISEFVKESVRERLRELGYKVWLL